MLLIEPMGLGLGFRGWSGAGLRVRVSGFGFRVESCGIGIEELGIMD